ncbi:MAG: hypothetical protein VKI81_12660 [Synechococcaceae cyanobacterium]|nr:hypothetical protein [Synechococcaceae cyanobacterium]
MDCRDLADLSNRVERVIGRIDAQVARLAAGLEVDPEALSDRLDEDTEELHELLVSLVRSASLAVRAAPADLDRTVAAAIRTALQTVPHPVVMREQLDGGLPPVAWSQGDLACAVQRALALATHHAGRGGEVAVTTGSRDGFAVLGLEARGAGDAHARDRTVTLRDYVDRLGGQCEAEVGTDGALLLRLLLPTVAPVDDR